MADPKITVEIGAVADGLIKNVDGSIRSLEQLQRELDDLDKKLRTAADPIEIIQLNQQIGALKTGMQSLRTAGLDPLIKAQSNYNSVGIDFARIIQDAPFGIIGVSNNITQLASSFGAARASGQSFTKILGSVFSGGNLLTLGISALTSAFVVLQQKGFFKTEEVANSLGDALDEYREKLDAVTRASIEGQGNAQREIQSFNLLRAQAENANIPLATRLEAVRDLKKEYPEYLNGLSNEQILTGKVGIAYDQLTKSLVATAKARAFSDQIAKNSIDLLTLEEQSQQNVTTILDKRAKLATLEAFALNQAAKSRGEITGLDLQIFDLRSEINDLEKDQVTNIENANKLKTENLNLESNISKQLENGAKFTQTQLNSLKEIKRTYEDISGISDFLDLAALERRAAFFQGIETPISIESGKATTQGLIEGVENVGNKFSEQADKIKLKVDELSGSFTGLGSLIGKAFNNPQLGSFLGEFASFAAKLIATNFTIASSNAVTGATSAAVATGPAAPFTLPGFIAASLGLVASAFAAFGGKRGGGGSFSGASGVSQGTSFTGGGQALQFDRSLNLVGEFRVKGQDLVYVFNEANSKNQRG